MRDFKTRFRFFRWRKLGSTAAAMDVWLVVNYDHDGNEVEEAVTVHLDYDPPDPSVGVDRGRWSVTSARFRKNGWQVPAHLITKSLIEEWEQEAAERAAEYEEGLRSAADDAKFQARRDGE